jgi:serine/threonine-protein kinase
MARQLAAQSPAQAVAQLLLAQALAARGKPEAAVREALKLRWAALSSEARKRAEPEETVALALLGGDFAAAERTATEIEAAAEPSRREGDHGAAARRLAEIYLETGRTADAGRVAQAFLGRRDAWDPDVRPEDYAMAADAFPELCATAFKAGQITRAELVERRTEWLRRWTARAGRYYRSYLWIHGFADTVETEADAREALSALDGGPDGGYPHAAGPDGGHPHPSGGGASALPSFLPRTLSEEAIGRTLLLAGRADEALPWLDRATRSCAVLEQPMAHTRAHLWLGMAREARHDKEGACSAYRVVLTRWGKAKPRSLTADRAAERTRALGCGG